MEAFALPPLPALLPPQARTDAKAAPAIFTGAFATVLAADTAVSAALAAESNTLEAEDPMRCKTEARPPNPIPETPCAALEIGEAGDIGLRRREAARMRGLRRGAS